MKKKIVALLPMKANSERVKGKNFKMLAGKPLFKWILDSLLAIPEIDVVVINTDARHILAENGLVETDRVIIRDRKPEICGDMTSMNLILADDIQAVPADLYLMTHTTNPHLSAATIKAVIERYNSALDNNEGDSVFTVNKFQTRFYTADAQAVNHDPNVLMRTQDLVPWFEENSNLYAFSADSFSATNARIGANPVLFEMSKVEAVDIDDPESWDMAEIIAFGQKARSEHQ